MSRVRASVALNPDYPPEAALLRDLGAAEEAWRGKLLRALIRAGYSIAHTDVSPAVPASEPQGDTHDA